MKKMMNISVLLVLVLFGLYLLLPKNEKEQNRVIVSVTTFALYDVATHIAGDTLKIVNILPFGAEPHEFEPTPKVMAEVEKSALVFYSGAGLEPWIAGFRFKSKAVDMSTFVKLNGNDPHYWLDFENLQKVAKVMSDEFCTLSPKNAKLYKDNYIKYSQMLKKLDESYKTELSNCKIDTVVMNHNALGYVGKRYGFSIESISGLSPEASPTPKDIQRIIKEIRSKHVKTIFFESFSNNKAIKTIASDANVSFDMFEPLGNISADELRRGLGYEEIMRLNLKKLSKALMCR